MGELARATLTVVDVTTGKLGEKLEVCFNPKDYSLDKKVAWTSTATKADAQPVEYGTPSPMSLSLALQFDTYEERVSVRDKWVRKLESLTLVGQTGGGAPGAGTTPPMVLFTWGNFKFKGVIESLSQKYTMFLQDGTPVRAECTLTIRNALDKQEEQSGVKADAREVAVPVGMTPDSAANAAYGDPTKWPKLLADNNVDDPLNFSGPLTVNKK